MSARNGTAVFSLIVLIVAGAAGCATAPASIAARGRVTSWSAGTRAVVRGPITLHAYAGFRGGEIYRAPAAVRPDADCAEDREGRPPIPLPADKVVWVTVPEGAVACLRTQSDAAYELLWYAAPQPRQSTATWASTYR